MRLPNLAAQPPAGSIFMELTRRALLGSALAVSAVPTNAATQVMRIAITTSLVVLDPLRTTLGDEYIYDNLVFNGLTRMREDLSVGPDLAASWTSTEDLRQWTFALRRGVKFHNGREMAADDVIATFTRLLDPKSAAPSRSNYEMIAAMSAPDPYTVRFDLYYPYSGFADILADRQVKIVPRDLVDQLTTKPIGTGPFMFQSYTPGDRLIMVKNPNYHEPGLPKLDGVELRIIPEMSVKIAALQAGDIDIIWDLPLDQVLNLKSDKSLRVESVRPRRGTWRS
jgi:peptide/nickel transport system substrate-binding protein